MNNLSLLNQQYLMTSRVNTAILDRWRMAMSVSRPWYLGSMDDRNTAADRLYCRTLAVVVQDRVMAEERMPLAVLAALHGEGGA